MTEVQSTSLAACAAGIPRTLTRCIAEAKAVSQAAENDQQGEYLEIEAKAHLLLLCPNFVKASPTSVVLLERLISEVKL